MTDESTNEPDPNPVEPPRPPAGPLSADSRQRDHKSNSNSAFLVLGFVFLVIAITNLAQESARGVGFAFIAVGIVFLVLGSPLSSRGRNHKG